jgi:hypothetical protein
VVIVILGYDVIAYIPCCEREYLVYMVFLILSEGLLIGTGGGMAKDLYPYYLLLSESFIQAGLVEVLQKI